MPLCLLFAFILHVPFLFLFPGTFPLFEGLSIPSVSHATFIESKILSFMLLSYPQEQTTEFLGLSSVKYYFLD
jgi:hypothetical protein